MRDGNLEGSEGGAVRLRTLSLKNQGRITGCGRRIHPHPLNQTIMLSRVQSSLINFQLGLSTVRA